MSQGRVATLRVSHRVVLTFISLNNQGTHSNSRRAVTRMRLDRNPHIPPTLDSSKKQNEPSCSVKEIGFSY